MQAGSRKILTVTGIGMAILALASVRGFEQALFYDPFLEYFKSDYTDSPIPQVDTFQFTVHLIFRYSLNTLFSLGMIQLVFRDWIRTKFAAVIYVVLLVVLLVLLQLWFAFSEDKMTLFYIRRFLIQPLFLLLFVPAFYFQDKVNKNAAD